MRRPAGRGRVTGVVEDGDIVGGRAGPHGRRAKCRWRLFGTIGRGAALWATCIRARGPLGQGKVVRDGCIPLPWRAVISLIADGEMVRGRAAIDDPCCAVEAGGRACVRSAASLTERLTARVLKGTGM